MKNEKGFTLIELLAVIVISTTVLVPLLSGLIGNFEVNKRMQARKAASSITLTTVDAFDKVPFENFEYIFQNRQDPYFGLGEEKIIEIAQSGSNIGCNDFVFPTNPSDANFVEGLDSEGLCNMIFNQQWNNIKFNDSDTFRVFVYPYYLEQGDIDDIMALGDVPLSEGGIPESVLNEVESLDPSTKVNNNVFRITVWIQYDTEYDDDIVSSGVVTRE